MKDVIGGYYETKEVVSISRSVLFYIQVDNAPTSINKNNEEGKQRFFLFD